MRADIEEKLKKQSQGTDLLTPVVDPPRADSGMIKGPSKMNSMGAIIDEQRRLYRLVFKGELALGDLTKLMYALQQIIQGIKAKSEIDELENAYTKAWTGVRIIAPTPADVPDPMQQAIEGEILRDGD